MSICSPQEIPVGERLSKYLPALQGVLRVVPSSAGCVRCHVPPGFCLDPSAEEGGGEECNGSNI